MELSQSKSARKRHARRDRERAAAAAFRARAEAVDFDPLHEAIESGDIDSIWKFANTHGGDLLAYDDSVVGRMIDYSDIEILQTMKACGMRLDDYQYPTWGDGSECPILALMVSLTDNDKAVIRLLHEMGYDFDHRDRTGHTWISAMSDWNPDAVAFLKSIGVGAR